MSQFVDSEAEESDDEEVINRKRKFVESDEDEVINRKRKFVESDEDEDEEDDEEKLREEMKDLINDDEVEEANDSDDSVRSRKKRRRSEDEDDRLEDDDYDLLEENLGVKVQRKKFKRLRRVEDDDDSDEGDGKREEQVDRDAIAGELFEGSDEEGGRKSPQGDDERSRQEFGDLSESEMESDPDDFIVDDDGQPIHKAKKRRHVKYNDAALQEAQDIFGVEFDFDDIQNYDEYEDEFEEEYEDEDATDADRQRSQKRSSKKKSTKKSIYEIYEPIELERCHFTDRDNEIRSTDSPERFQLRTVPVTAPEKDEIDEEADWIYKYAFSQPPLSNQSGPGDRYDNEQYLNGFERKSVSCVGNIREALTFIREKMLEVPFIAFYRKEYIEPELNINDLWTIYKYDEKWCQLRTRKQNLMKLFKKMQTHLCDELLEKPDEILADNFKTVSDADILRLSEVQTPEELKDFYSYFLLHFAKEVDGMNESYRKQRMKQREVARQEREKLGEEGVDIEAEKTEHAEEEEDVQEAEKERVRFATRKNAYSMCYQAGLDGMVKKFGLSAEYFGENLRDNYQRHEVDQYPVEPLEAAKEHTSSKFPSADDVLKASRYMASVQISCNTVVRQCVRETYYERAKISVRPTKKGMKEIDENHPCYSYKYLKNKRIKDLIHDQYLNISIAEEDKLLIVSIGIDGAHSTGRNTYLEEIKQLYQRDEFSKNVQEWNAERSQILETAITKILFNVFEIEVKNKLLQEARDYVVRACRTRLYNWLKIAPYQVDQQVEDDEDFDTREGVRIMSLAYVPDRDTAAFAALVDGYGQVTDYRRLPSILKRRDAYHENDRIAKEEDVDSLRKFILAKKPHVVAVSAESRDALMIVEDISKIISELVESEQFPMISVELVNNDLANLYMNSSKSESDFRDYPPLLRQAISIARRLQDPLTEFSQLCTPEEDILCLKYHHSQDQIPKEDLLSELYLEFINRINEVGVDVDRCIDYPHTSNLLQFVSGLGLRKAAHIMKTLKQSSQHLENRMQLVTVYHMGPKVFVNCAGFIKIDTNAMANADAYIEVLDGSRVHPEMYEWARKMAVDALDYDDDSEDANPAAALDEILESPERLKDLDLDAFAAELKKQGFGNKSIALYDIRAELNHRYKDIRVPYRPPTLEDRFNMLSKETPRTFHVGKLVLARVFGFAHRKPKPDELDKANPIRNDDQGFWQCPFCLKNDFPDLSEVWNHFDAGSCPGQAMGVKTRLDNGCNGFIPTKMISDKQVTNPEERVQYGMSIHCRVTKIDIERFNVDLTCKSSDLCDKNNEFKPPKDVYYDFDEEDKDRKINAEIQKKKSRQTYIKRVIVHPSFHNISFKDAEKLLTDMDQGEVVVRPSSKGADHLTATWKVHDGIYQHIDVKEEDKENAFSLGQSLHIQNEEFEDLDEIIARHIQPMAAFARDVITYKYFRDGSGGKREVMEQLILEDKQKQPSKIHYLVSASKEFPGKFMISYIPRNKVRHEYLTVTPEGFRFRQQIFPSLSSLLRWFKEHFRDPIPGTTPQSVIGARTPMGQSSYIGAGATPSINLANVNVETIQRAAANLPSHVFNTLSQVAGQTPVHFGYQPYTPSQPVATPIMTPSYPITTPRYQPTPSWATPGHLVQTPSHHTPHHNQPVTPLHIQQIPARTRTMVQSVTPRQNPQATPDSQHRITQQKQTSGAKQSMRTSQQDSRSASDWKKMAEEWAKKQHEQNAKTKKSPRPDATPLIDEQ